MPFQPDNFVCWMEIPVTDIDRATAFYNAVFETELTRDDSGPNPMAIFPFPPDKPSVAGHLYPGKPPAKGSGPTIHIVVPGKLEEAMERVTKAGGEVVSPAIAIPPGRFAYAHDLDGNSIGLFERA